MRDMKHDVLQRAPRTLKGRLILWNILVLLLTLALLAFVVYSVVSHFLISNLDTRLQQEAIQLQEFTSTWQKSGHAFDSDYLNQLVHVEQADEFTANASYIKLLDPRNGHLLLRSPNLGKVRLPLNLADFNDALQNRSLPQTYEDNQGRQVRIVTIALRDSRQQVVVVAQVSQSLEAIQQVSLPLGIVLVIGIFFAALVAYIGGLIVLNRELRPLQTLSTTMLHLSTQRLGTRLPLSQNVTEIQQLSDAFNQMAERLEASFALQRTFVADVSHELRTPLTTLSGQIDVLLLDPALKDETRKDVQQVRAELGRMSRMVNNLLVNARAEAGVIQQVPEERRQSVEMDALFIEIARQTRFLTQEVSLRLGELEQVSVAGDRDLLKQLLLNLVDNALTYTPPRGRITLTLTSTRAIPDELRREVGNGQRIWVKGSICDTGSGIAPDDLPHIFERYYRASGTSARGKLSSGLGLSIALLIAQAHGGTILVESVLGQGSCFHLWLPLYTESAP